MVFAAQKMQAPKTIPTIPSRTEENVIPPAKRDRAVLAAVLGGVLLSSLLTWAPVVREVSSGTRIIAVTVAVAALCAVIWPREEEAADA